MLRCELNISTVKSHHPMNANRPNESMFLVQGHKITAERRQRI